MKTVKKYTTFEDLKSTEKKVVDAKVRIEKHTEFEKVIKEIQSGTVHKEIISKPK